MQANAEAIGIDLSDDEEDEEGPQGRQKGRQAAELTGMRAQLGELLAAPLQPSISRKFFTGGVSALGAAAAKAAASAAPAAQEGEPQEEVRGWLVWMCGVVVWWEVWCGVWGALSRECMQCVCWCCHG